MVRNAIWIAIVALQIVFLWVAPSFFNRSDLDTCAGSDAAAEPACRRVLAQGKWTARQKAGAHLRLADFAGLGSEARTAVANTLDVPDSRAALGFPG
jgi:hypothetical protein